MSLLVLTRPFNQSLSFSEALTLSGVASEDIIIDPILRIEPVTPIKKLKHFRSIILTSSNALKHLPPCLVGSRLPAFCAGNSTTETAISHGFLAKCLGETATDLCNALFQSSLPEPVAYLCGDHITLDFEEFFRGSKLWVENIICYRQISGKLSMATIKVLNDNRGSIVPVFSQRSACLLCEQNLNWKEHCAVSISKNTAEICKKAGFGKRIVAAHPSAQSMLAAIKSLIELTDG